LKDYELRDQASQFEEKLHNAHNETKKAHNETESHKKHYESEIKSLTHKIKELEDKLASGGGAHDDDFDRYAF
jgi:predicted  nucleic acid-binding Zn-ribbon protein